MTWAYDDEFFRECVSLGEERVRQYREAGWSFTAMLLWMPWATWVHATVAAGRLGR